VCAPTRSHHCVHQPHLERFRRAVETRQEPYLPRFLLAHQPSHAARTVSSLGMHAWEQRRGQENQSSCFGRGSCATERARALVNYKDVVQQSVKSVMAARKSFATFMIVPGIEAPHTWTRLPKNRVVSSDGDVADHVQNVPSANGVAGNRSNDRLRAPPHLHLAMREKRRGMWNQQRVDAWHG
jgi:hypothetical protein